MTEISHQDFSIAQTLSLIDSYAFDLGGHSAERILQEWLEVYHSSWIRLATIEALYLGRYKIISIEHILNVWLRLGNPNPHFTHEFERLICRKLPRHLIDYSDFHLATMSSNEGCSPDHNVSDCYPRKGLQALEETSRDSPSNSQANRVSEKSTAKTQDLKSSLRDSQRKTQAAQATSEVTSSAASCRDSSDFINNSLIPALDIAEQNNWTKLAIANSPIDQFVPLPDFSSFFNKLKTFAIEQLES